MNIALNFLLNKSTLPSVVDQWRDLWLVARALESVGVPLNGWYPPADTPALSLLNKAFDESGPTPAAIAITQAEERGEKAPWYRETGVWNGIEGPGGIAYTSTLTIDEHAPNCIFSLQSEKVQALLAKKNILTVLQKLLAIWPARIVEIAPYKYSSTQQVFPKRPGVGWMMYLPITLTVKQVPEAAELIPVKGENGHPDGTVIVSIADEPFDSNNPEHVKAANRIEVRLADQDLLPRY